MPSLLDPPCPTLIARGYALDEVPCRCPAFSRFLSVKPPWRCDACGRLVELKAPKNLPPGMVPPYRCLPPSQPSRPLFDFPALTRLWVDSTRGLQIRNNRKKDSKPSSLRVYLEDLRAELSDPPNSEYPEEYGYRDLDGEGQSFEDLAEQKSDVRANETSSAFRGLSVEHPRATNRSRLLRVRPGPYMEMEERNRHADGSPSNPSLRPTSSREERHKFCTSPPSLMTRSRPSPPVTPAVSALERTVSGSWRLPGSPMLKPGVAYFRRFRPGADVDYSLKHLPFRRRCSPAPRPEREKRPAKNDARKTKFDPEKPPWNPHFQHGYTQMAFPGKMRESQEKLYGTNTYLGGHKVFPV